MMEIVDVTIRIVTISDTIHYTSHMILNIKYDIDSQYFYMYVINL
jgi:hypothetical protein